jgi:hypothetical protein
MSGSKEVVDLNFGLGGTILTARVTEIELTASTLEASGDHAASNALMSASMIFDSSSGGSVGITYEQLQVLIESVLAEHGYYDMPTQIRQLPVASVGSQGGPSQSGVSSASSSAGTKRLSNV